MREIKKYEAEDGKLFDSAQECGLYENNEMLIEKYADELWKVLQEDYTYEGVDLDKFKEQSKYILEKFKLEVTSNG